MIGSAIHVLAAVIIVIGVILANRRFIRQLMASNEQFSDLRAELHIIAGRVADLEQKAKEER